MTLITRASSALCRWWWRLWPSSSQFVVDQEMWRGLIVELGRRGLDGQREAGAFLLASRLEDERRVARVIYFDELDPCCLVGHIHLRSGAFSKLWDLCEADGLRVIADVHTHPSVCVAQSDLDRENPMIARTGHLALIVPCYGTRPVKAHEVGVHEYCGDLGWKSWLGPKAERVLRIRGR